jgi:hypothetical protein
MIRKFIELPFSANYSLSNQNITLEISNIQLLK